MGQALHQATSCLLTVRACLLRPSSAWCVGAAAALHALVKGTCSAVSLCLLQAYLLQGRAEHLHTSMESSASARH